MEVSEAVRSITDYFRLSMRYYYSNFHLFAKLCQQLAILVSEFGAAGWYGNTKLLERK